MDDRLLPADDPPSIDDLLDSDDLDEADEVRRLNTADAVRGQIRGSSLLLVGRLISMAAGLGIQVLVVRNLSKEDYGAFAYVMSLVTTATTVLTFGLDQALFRFAPIFDERREDGLLKGTVLLYVGTIASLGFALVLLAYGLQSHLEGSLLPHEETRTLVLILVFLAPLQSLDEMFQGLFAIFVGPRAIFLRRHVATPLLRLTVVLLLIATGSGVPFLAAGYVVAGACGVALYGSMFLKAVRRSGLARRMRESRAEIPFREIYSFSIPIFLNDVVFVVVGLTATVMLGREHGSAEVASFRAILPYAGLNTFVIASFSLMFNPLAARLYARGDHAGVAHLYWRTAVWVAVLSFPVFALTFSLAEPLVDTLLGPRYDSSATYLAIISFGAYAQAASGFNGHTLKVYGLVRYSVAISMASAVVNLVLTFALVPPHGALGAAIAVCITYLVHNTLKQIGLRLGTGINLFEREYLSLYVWIVVCAAGLLVFQVAISPHPLAGLALAVGASALILHQGRSRLSMAETFPELAKVPLLRRLL